MIAEATEKTVTKAEVTAQFCITDRLEALQSIQEGLEKQVDLDYAGELLETIKYRTEEAEKNNGESTNEWEPWRKFLWTLKEAYILGFLRSTEIQMDAAELAVSTLFGEQSQAGNEAVQQ